MRFRVSQSLNVTARVCLIAGSWNSEDLPDTSETCIQRDLRLWAANHNITQAALKDVAGIINKNCNTSIASDPRTIMKTPRNVTIVSLKSTDPPVITNAVQKKEKQEYWHQGFEHCLRSCFRLMEKDVSISININIDGLPIHNSTNQSFWPILFNVNEYPGMRPMVIGIFCGDSKPESAQLYLQPCVDEMKIILRDGLRINGHRLAVRIRCIICDSPARAFVKGTMNYNGLHGCQKCTTVGKHSHVSRTTIFPSISAAPRTDEQFRNGSYPLHHRYRTPIEELPIDTIKDFVVADPLHLLELGVMKRLIQGWTSTEKRLNFGYKTKLSLTEKSEISQLLLQIRVPSEIHRDARTLKMLPKWKGLEYRNFLNYFGIAVMKTYLPAKNYTHFLKLFCAVRFCSSDIYTGNLNVAQMLFDDFINEYKVLYGSEYITSNVHNLHHVVGDVERFGVLQSISAYPFESALYTIKRALRVGKNPLVQIAKRLGERQFNIDSNFAHLNEKTVSITRFKEGWKMQLPTYILTCEFKDKWFLFKNKIFKMVKATRIGNEYFIEAFQLKYSSDFFEAPFLSSLIDVYLSRNPEIFCENPISINIRDIKCKFVAIKMEKGKALLFIPLLHSLKNV